MSISPVFFFAVIAVAVVLLPSQCFGVVELGDINFKWISQYETILVLFYAPWCNRCKALRPEFSKAAETLKTNYPPVILAQVDCTSNGAKTCRAYKVNGFPTLKIFRYGKVWQEYNGPRDAPGIVRFMKTQVRGSSGYGEF